MRWSRGVRRRGIHRVRHPRVRLRTRHALGLLDAHAPRLDRRRTLAESGRSRRPFWARGIPTAATKPAAVTSSAPSRDLQAGLATSQPSPLRSRPGPMSAPSREPGRYDAQTIGTHSIVSNGINLHTGRAGPCGHADRPVWPDDRGPGIPLGGPARSEVLFKPTSRGKGCGGVEGSGVEAYIVFGIRACASARAMRWGCSMRMRRASTAAARSPNRAEAAVPSWARGIPTAATKPAAVTSSAPSRDLQAGLATSQPSPLRSRPGPMSAPSREPGRYDAQTIGTHSIVSNGINLHTGRAGPCGHADRPVWPDDRGPCALPGPHRRDGEYRRVKARARDFNRGLDRGRPASMEPLAPERETAARRRRRLRPCAGRRGW